MTDKSNPAGQGMLELKIEANDGVEERSMKIAMLFCRLATEIAAGSGDPGCVLAGLITAYANLAAQWGHGDIAIAGLPKVEEGLRVLLAAQNAGTQNAAPHGCVGNA